jgi:glycosyltransferase involved in cell wall biosynthesis
VGGVPHVVSDRTSGLLVEPSDAPKMARAVQELLEHPSLASKLSLKGSESAQAHDWSRVLPQWEELFQEIAEDA